MLDRLFSLRRALYGLLLVLAVGMLAGGLSYAPSLHEGAKETGLSGPSCKSRDPDACEVAGRDPDEAVAKEEEERPDNPGAAARLRFLQDSNENGVIPRNALVRAADHADAMKTRPMPGAATAPQSTGDNLQPSTANIDRSLWTWLGPGNIGGRIRSLAIDPNDPQVMWAGSVGGGIWKTTDGGASWQPLDDFMANLAVSTLVIDPNNPSVLYAGTGEGFYNGDGIRGAGVFKTTDGGATWTQLPTTATPDFYYVNRLAISPDGQTILAATGTGLFRSSDGGASWNQVLNPGGKMADVAFDPADSGKAVASGYQRRIYYSANGGASWTAAAGMPASADGYDGGRVEVAYAPSNPSIVYLVLDNGSGQIYKSTDGGQSYTLVNNDYNNWLGSQGWYDNALWVDPTNPNTLVVGGVDLWRSTNGGATLTRISQWQSAPASSAHADQHAIVSSPGYNGTTNKTVFIGDDGGVYKASDISTVSQTSGWQELNNNLGITQFYGGAGNNQSGTVVGGTQDNGSLTDTGDPEDWNAMFGGDGGFSAADPTDPNYFYGEYVYLQIHRSTNGGASSGYIYSGIGDAGNSSNALFIAPFILDPNNPNTMLAGGRSLWRSTNVKAGSPGWASIKGPAGTTYYDNISAIAVAPGNSDVIWVGHANGGVYKTTNGTASSPTWTRMDLNTPNLPDRYVADLTVDPNNPNVVYATFGGYSPDNVYKTTDGGSTWTDITGSGTTGLPDAPVRSLVINPNNPNWLYAGTEVGVFASEDGGATWSVPTDGPANVSVDQLFWMGTKLVAVTHGRGMFTAETNDTTPPDTSIDSGPSGPTRSTSASLTFSSTEAGSTFECSLDGAAFGPCSSPKGYTTLPNGSHTFRVRATDPAGNTDPTPATRSWKVDTIKPTGTVKINGTATYTRSPSVKLSLSATDPAPPTGVVFMRLMNDGGGGGGWSAWQPYAASKSWTLRKLNGLRGVYVQYRDRAGNVSKSALDTIKLDMTKPTISPISPKPASITHDSTPTIKAKVTDDMTDLKKANIRVYVNGVLISAFRYSYSASTDVLLYDSPKVSVGRKVVRVVARDAAGNVGASSWYFTIR